jgi:hypothetical protein
VDRAKGSLKDVKSDAADKADDAGDKMSARYAETDLTPASLLDRARRPSVGLVHAGAVEAAPPD